MNTRNKKQEEQIRAAFYIRVSTDDQVEKYGVDLQLDALHAILRSKGKLEDGRDAMVLAGPDKIYKDEGISGTIELEERPAFSRMIEDIETLDNPFDVVIVYKIDRFARRLKILLDAVDFFEEHEIKFISANESIDTTSPFGKAILGIVGVIAELEIETTKARTQAGREQAIKQGVFMGQVAPFGYEKDVNKRLAVFEPEAQIVRDIYSWFIYENLSAQQIADRLLADEVLSPDASAIFHEKRKGDIKKKNNPYFWRLEKVRELLSDEVYLGKYWYGKSETDKKTKKVSKIPRENWKLSPYRHPSIIEPMIFDMAQKALAQSIKKVRLASKKKGSRLYMLSGLLKCTDCVLLYPGAEKATWVGDRKALDKSKKSYSYYYKCGRKNRKKHTHVCTVLPVPAESLEEYVVDFVKKLLANPEHVYEYHRNLKSTKKRYAHLRSRKEKIISHLNSIPERIKNLQIQHRDGFIKTSAELRKQIDEQEHKAKKYTEDVKKIENEIGRHEVSEGYLQVFREFADKYKDSMEELFSDKKETYKLLHILIHEIDVSSRPVTELDKISGRKVKDQKIPWSIDIELRLPQEIITDLARSKFWVRSGNG